MQNDKNVKSTLGTILEVTLKEPIKPGNSTTLSLKFGGKVPDLRQAGKNSPEGVALSMAQWYLKWQSMTMMVGMLSHT